MSSRRHSEGRHARARDRAAGRRRSRCPTSLATSSLGRAILTHYSRRPVSACRAAVSERAAFVPRVVNATSFRMDEALADHSAVFRHGALAFVLCLAVWTALLVSAIRRTHRTAKKKHQRRSDGSRRTSMTVLLGSGQLASAQLICPPPADAPARRRRAHCRDAPSCRGSANDKIQPETVHRIVGRQHQRGQGAAA